MEVGRWESALSDLRTIQNKSGHRWAPDGRRIDVKHHRCHAMESTRDVSHEIS
jgi:hypothetical protein